MWLPRREYRNLLYGSFKNIHLVAQTKNIHMIWRIFMVFIIKFFENIYNFYIGRPWENFIFT